MDDLDLSLPENNSFIPKENDEDPEVTANPLILPEHKQIDPHFGEKILKQLQDSELAQVGEAFILQRRYKHNNASGGEEFVLSDGSGVERRISLTQLAGVHSEDDLRKLLEE